MSAAPADNTLASTRDAALIHVAHDLAQQPPEWESKRDLIKKMFAPKATDDELELFLYVAKTRRLDPLKKQLYCIHRYDNQMDNGANKPKGGWKMSIQTGIDGFRAIADRTGRYAGSDDPVFEGSTTVGAFPEKCTVTVYKVVAGMRCPFVGVARWTEFYPGKAQGFMWERMPYHMLSKCAEALALRKAFPEDLGDIRINEEMERYGGQIVDAETGALMSPTYEVEPQAIIQQKVDPHGEPLNGPGSERTVHSTAAAPHGDDPNPFDDDQPVINAKPGQESKPAAFGHEFTWPKGEWFDIGADAGAVKQMAIQSNKRGVPEDLRQFTCHAILKSVAPVEVDTFEDEPYSTKKFNKGQAFLVVDFLKKASEDSLSAAMQAGQQILNQHQEEAG